MAKSIEDGSPLDLSETTYRDDDIAIETENWSIDLLAKHVARLEKEADQLEQKLKTMSMKERHEWDKIYPFSITDHDNARNELLDYIESKMSMAKDIEGGASADEEEKEYAQVEPELKEWYDA